MLNVPHVQTEIHQVVKAVSLGITILTIIAASNSVQRAIWQTRLHNNV